MRYAYNGGYLPARNHILDGGDRPPTRALCGAHVPIYATILRQPHPEAELCKKCKRATRPL